MPGIADAIGPTYISSHSADVILSDIRPIKLKIDALRSINVLLDEFLYSILSTSCSLSTDKLRASLLSLLPTSLGKEALLEAEVELRAYWDRTGPMDVTVSPLEDDVKTFHLQWAFELLRLKCEAYSTLNESDEDSGAESRINERFRSTGGTPPKAGLMAPAALYLTAILEAMCEHILSNVGRVASRDSSRTSGTAQDLFVALCEDHSIYGLFKTMKVYDQIEQLSKAPKPRRSKSFTRNDRHSRTSSPHQDLTTKDASSARSRISSETTGATGPGAPSSANQSSRSSFEKTRAIKMFMVNSRSSNDDGQSGHRKTDSTLSENSKQTLTISSDIEPPAFEDEALQQEFDDLMRSSSTMKVSLTPDRLKTMEVYKQEKGQRGNQRPVPLSFKSDPDSSVLPPRATGRRPSLLRVDSIKEDEEEFPSPSAVTRSRQGSITNPPTTTAPPSRTRAVSTSSAIPRVLTKLSRTSTPPPAMPPPSSGPLAMQNRHAPMGFDPFPPRTRNVQHNRESLDLDDIMGGSDDDSYAPPTPVKHKQVTSPNRPGQVAVSAGTRDLMDFLAQGPPDVPEFSTDGTSGLPAVAELGKSKGSGRLQRMISKLSLGNADKSRGAFDDGPKSRPSQTPSRPPHPQPASNLSPLANRPIPPRPPRAISPPSPAHSEIDQDHVTPRAQGYSSSHSLPKSRDASENSSPVTPHKETNGNAPWSRRPPLPSHVNGHHSHREAIVDEPANDSSSRNMQTTTNGGRNQYSPVEPPQPRMHKSSSITRKPVPAYSAAPSKPHISGTDALDMHRLLSKATSAEECRLLCDLFLAKSGILVGPIDHGTPYPPSSPSVTVRPQITPADVALEHSLVEMLLGGDHIPEPEHRKGRSKKRSKPEAVVEPSQRGEKTHGNYRVANRERRSSHRNMPGLPGEGDMIVDNPPAIPATPQRYTPISEAGT